MGAMPRTTGQPERGPRLNDLVCDSAQRGRPWEALPEAQRRSRVTCGGQRACAAVTRAAVRSSKAGPPGRVCHPSICGSPPPPCAGMRPRRPRGVTAGASVRVRDAQATSPRASGRPRPYSVPIGEAHVRRLRGPLPPEPLPRAVAGTRWEYPRALFNHALLFAGIAAYVQARDARDGPLRRFEGPDGRTQPRP